MDNGGGLSRNGFSFEHFGQEYLWGMQVEMPERQQVHKPQEERKLASVYGVKSPLQSVVI